MIMLNNLPLVMDLRVLADKYPNHKIYVAIPFTKVEERSFRISNQVSVDLINLGLIPFAPISMTYPIWLESKVMREGKHSLSGKWDVWEKIDKAFIDWCDVLIIADFDGKLVDKSVGVKAEVEYALESGKPVYRFIV